VLRYPAIAEQDEIHVTKLGQHVRKAGEALLPSWKPLNFLMERQRTQTAASWESEYQQHPIIVGGGVLPIEKLKIMPYWSPQGSDDIIATIRFWDKAGTEKGGNYTAGVLMHYLKDGRFVISHIARGQWGAYERERQIKYWADDDSRIHRNYEVGIEQEPGSGGKESAENTVRNLVGYAVYVDKVTGSKEARANRAALSGHCRAGRNPRHQAGPACAQGRRGAAASVEAAQLPAGAQAHPDPSVVGKRIHAASHYRGWWRAADRETQDHAVLVAAGLGRHHRHHPLLGQGWHREGRQLHRWRVRNQETASSSRPSCKFATPANVIQK
jgi:hypothetical protein